MAKPNNNGVILKTTSEQLDGLLQTVAASSLPNDDLLMDTEPLTESVTAIQTQLQSLDFDNLTEQDISQLKSIQNGITALSERMRQHRDTTKNAILNEQTKSKLKKAYG